MNKLASAFFIAILLTKPALAISLGEVEGYLRGNSGIDADEFAFKSSEKRAIKLASFADPETNLNFLVDSTPGFLKDDHAIPAKVNDKDTVVSCGRLDKYCRISDSYGFIDQQINNEMRLAPKECVRNDLSGMRRLKWLFWAKWLVEGSSAQASFLSANPRTVTLGNVIDAFPEKPDKCIRAALIDRVIKDNNGQNAESKYGSRGFLNKMLKMDFRLEQVVVEVFSFDLKGTGRKGCQTFQANVFVLDEKPIAVGEDVMCLD